jgi:hypothetical protein
VCFYPFARSLSLSLSLSFCEGAYPSNHVLSDRVCPCSGRRFPWAVLQGKMVSWFLGWQHHSCDAPLWIVFLSVCSFTSLTVLAKLGEKHSTLHAITDTICFSLGPLWKIPLPLPLLVCSTEGTCLSMPLHLLTCHQ